MLKKLIYTGVLVGLFAYGILVGKYEVFPHDQLAGLKRPFAGTLENELVEGQFSKEVVTAHVTFDRAVYNFLDTHKLKGWGGALSRYKEGALGVDKEGHFFYYRKGGEITKLPHIKMINNEGAVRRLLDQEGLDSLTYNRIMNNFRIMDILVQDHGEHATLFMSYHYFDTEANAKSLRIAKTTIDNETLKLGAKEVLFTDIFTAQPAVEYDATYDSSFRSNRTGGRMILLNPQQLMIGIGDHQHDGFSTDRRDPQDDASDNGKAIVIDLISGQHEHFAKGLRNPQGLLLTSSGAILQTEHGPQGGDELNLLEAGHNYGWPEVTYGVNYGATSWPLQTEVGRHEGYVKPIMTWLPSIATSNLIQAESPAAWRGDILLGTLKESSIYRLRYEQGRIIFSEKVYVGERVRDLEQLTDGTLLLWTDNGRLMELEAQATGEQGEQAITTNTFTVAEVNAGIPDLLKMCQECHSLNKAATGALPSLSSLFMSPIAGGVTGNGYQSYSGSLRSMNDRVWDRDNLDAFLADPEQFASGTPMRAFAVQNEQQRALLIEYLAQIKQ